MPAVPTGTAYAILANRPIAITTTRKTTPKNPAPTGVSTPRQSHRGQGKDPAPATGDTAISAPSGRRGSLPARFDADVPYSGCEAAWRCPPVRRAAGS